MASKATRLSTKIPGLVTLGPQVHSDARGWLKEAVNFKELPEWLGLDPGPPVQINHSMTVGHTIRGLHFQKPPFAQTKLVRCLSGRLRDVAVDIRRGSPTYGQWESFDLSGDKHRWVYVPEGFAHGFHAIATCEMEYVIFGNGYHPESEGGLRPTDPALGIEWTRFVAQRSTEPRINERDRQWPTLAEMVTPFIFE